MAKGPFGEDLGKVPFFPKDRMPDAEITEGRSTGVIKRITMLENHPNKECGTAWKSFFKRLAGKDLDSPKNITVIPGMFPAFLPWEAIESGDFFFVWVLQSLGGDIALHGHALYQDNYVASWMCAVAPRRALELDEFALKMVLASSIEGARRALTVIAKEKVGTDLSKATWKPQPRDFHQKIQKEHAANLRGAPAFRGVQWSDDADVDPNDDFFNAFSQ